MEQKICLVEGHFGTSIIRICLSRDCIRKCEACQACWIQLHEDHVTDCLTTYEMIKNLLNEEWKLNQIHQNLTREFQNSYEKVTTIMELIMSYITMIRITIEKLDDNPYEENVIQFTKKCYNKLIYEEILYQIIIELQSNEQQMLSVKQQIQIVQWEENHDYIIERLIQKSNDLFEAQHYYESKQMLDQLLTQLVNNQMIEKKYLSLIMLNRIKEANQFLHFHKQQGASIYNILGNSLRDDIFLNYFFQYVKKPLEYENSPLFWEFAQAIILFYSKYFEKSLEILTKVLETNPQNVIVIELYVKNLIELKRFDEAIEFCDQKLQKYPSNEALFRIKCMCLFGNRENKQEISVIDQSDDKQLYLKGSCNIKNQVYNQYFIQNRLKNLGNQLIEKIYLFIIIKLSDGNQKIKQEDEQKFQASSNHKPHEIAYLISQKKYDEAQSSTENLLETWPKSKLLWIFKSNYVLYEVIILIQKYKMQDALECSEVLTIYYPQDQMTHFIKAICLIYCLQIDNAITYLDQVIDYRQFDVLELKGRLLLTQDKKVEAMECFKVCCLKYPNHKNSFFYRGFIFLAQNDLQNAYLDFTRVIHLDSSYEPAIYNQGVALSMMDKYDKALRIFEKILDYKQTRIIQLLSTAKKHHQALVEIAKINSNQEYYQQSQLLKCENLIRLRRFQEACDILETIDRSTYSDYINRQYMLCLIKVGQFVKADHWIDTFIQNNKQSYILHFLKAYSLHSQQNYQEAYNVYDQTFSIRKTPFCILALIDILEKMQKHEESLNFKRICTIYFPEFQYSTDYNDHLLDLVIQRGFRITYDQGDLLNYRYDISQIAPDISFDDDTLNMLAEDNNRQSFDYQ